MSIRIDRINLGVLANVRTCVDVEYIHSGRHCDCDRTSGEADRIVLYVVSIGGRNRHATESRNRLWLQSALASQRWVFRIVDVVLIRIDAVLVVSHLS